MTNNTRARVLDALEQDCVEYARRFNSLMFDTNTDQDAAANFGVMTPRIANLAGGVTVAETRRILNEEAAQGRVIKWRPYPRTIAWWPVGLLATLKKEA